MRYMMVLTLAGVLACQEATDSRESLRDRGFGRVTDKGGKPWANAEVRLVHQPHAALTDPRYGEEIVLRTDARGQFKVELLAGCTYSAWACGPVENDRSYRITGSVTAVARTPILLRETERQYALRVRPELHDSWQGKETLRWCVGRPNGSIGQWLEIGDDGTLELPRWPQRFLMLCAWADGWQVQRTGYFLNESYALQYGLRSRSGEKKPTAATVREVMAATQVLPVPQRQVREFTLTGTDEGKPIANAAIVPDHPPRRYAPPRSDADGRVQMLFASDDPLTHRLPAQWLVLPRRHRESRLGAVSHTRGESPVTGFALPPGRTLDGRVLLGGKPAGDVPLLLEASIPSGSGNGVWFGADARLVPSTQDGRFALPGRSEQFSFRVTAALSPQLRAQLQKGPRPIAPLAILRWEGEPLKAFGDVHLDRLRTLDIQVQSADGTPPGTTRVVLARFDAGEEPPRDPVVVRTDHRGAVRVLLAQTDDLFVHAVTATGGGWARLQRGAKECRLTMDARHVVRLRVVDQNGTPVQGASVSIVTPDPTADVDPELHRVLHNMYMVHGIARKSCTTDENGDGTLLSPLPRTRLDLALRKGDIDQRTTLLWEGKTGDPVDIVLRR